MRTSIILVLSLAGWAMDAWAQSGRFVVDDDAYVDKVTATASRLLKSGKLVSQHALRGQVQTKGFALKTLTPAQHKLEPTDLFESVRQSTFAVGTFYKCPDCGEWHFNSSTGFVAGDEGILCTCCHVVTEVDATVRESYLIAADAEGHVYPVRSVLAADSDSDTCLLRLDAHGLKPLPLRAGARTGEHVYCLSHPGGYFFMFTQGLIARLNRRPNDAQNRDSALTDGRRVLFLNVTAEFAPGSSGAPLVDEAGNVLGQVASIADAGEPDPGNEKNAASPSVPIRFCTAAEEILRLANPVLDKPADSQSRRPKREDGKPKIRKLRLVQHPCRKNGI